jgi:glycosyltransferase involved in cell wall biosynthesis
MQESGTFDISVVLPTYNRAGMLHSALESLVKLQTGGKFSYEIVVVDDGSTDNTSAVVKKVAGKHPEVALRYLYQPGHGAGRARNLGVEKAQGRYVAFFDDDQVADPLWLVELYQVVLERGSNCVDGPVCLDLPAGDQKLTPKTREVLGERFLGSEVGGYSSKENLGTGNFMIKRTLFHMLGGFDVKFRQCHDADFFWRLEESGHHSLYTPHALVHHVIPASRLEEAYLRNVCLRRGLAYAHIMRKYQGPLKLALAFFWRLGVTLGRDLPLYVLRRLLGPEGALFDKRIDLWYAIGFIRAGFFYLAPRFSPHDTFCESIYSSYHGNK